MTNTPKPVLPFGVGWTFVPIFGRRDIHDLSEGLNSKDPSSAPIFKGSPRSLFYIDGALDYGRDVVQYGIDSKLIFNIFTFEAMK